MSNKRGPQHKKSDLNKAYTHWLAYYKKIKSVYCPAFKQEVLFSDWGWKHISNVDKFRTGNEQIKRWNLLPLSKKILENSYYYQNMRYEDRHYRYRFTAIIEGKKMSVIVSKHKDKYYFLSNFTGE